MFSVDVFLADGAQWVDIVRILLLTVSTAWLAWGASVALNGLVPPFWRLCPDLPADACVGSVRVAVLVPAYNEDPAKTFSHLCAMAESVTVLGAAETFHFVLLSDTTGEDIARNEEYWLARLRAELPAEVRVFYRRRLRNTGRKAGNITDFIERSGGLYDFLIILDADSLMEGATMLEMVRRMQADPQLGLLQSLPRIVHARSLFGRIMQFAASYYSPIHARGLAELGGDTGTFWGHNAIVRTRAFASCCGLPELTGRPPFGGHILSHDFVEAALLARGGWKVRIAADLGGSFEEGPENVIDHAKRDRRWCQGNLQHARVIDASGLAMWSRFSLAQGIMAYLASPAWATFLAASIVAPAIAEGPEFFEVTGLPVFPPSESVRALTLLTGVLGLLLVPKLLIVLHGSVTGRNRDFGGTFKVVLGVLVEILVSSLLAPIMLLYQCRSVLQVVLGRDSGWPATNREAGAVAASEAWAASWWICVAGLVTLAAAYALAPDLIYWILPVAAPAVVAPLLIQSTSFRFAPGGQRRIDLLTVPADVVRSPVVRRQARIHARWRIGAGRQAEDAPRIPAPSLDAAVAE